MDATASKCYKSLLAGRIYIVIMASQTIILSDGQAELLTLLQILLHGLGTLEVRTHVSFLFISVTYRQERMHQRMNSVEALVSTVEGHVLELGLEFHKAKEAFLISKDVVMARTEPPSPCLV